jgi:uncharacterized protein YbjT (DUF2867 family)
MKVILFGATGMVGQGVLRECLADPDVEKVLVVGRSALERSDPKLEEILHRDALDYGSIADRLGGYDACFYCLGVSAAGMSEADYRKITLDATLAAARVLVKTNPEMTFVYVSGAGTDSSEKGSSMWARIKGETENRLLELPFRRKLMFRPGYIQPLHGIKSKTRLYRVAYAIGAPLYPLIKALAPNAASTTEIVGRAMLAAAKKGAPKEVLEVTDINALAREASTDREADPSRRSSTT